MPVGFARITHTLAHPVKAFRQVRKAKLDKSAAKSTTNALPQGPDSIAHTSLSSSEGSTYRAAAAGVKPAIAIDEPPTPQHIASAVQRGSTTTETTSRSSIESFDGGRKVKNTARSAAPSVAETPKSIDDIYTMPLVKFHTLPESLHDKLRVNDQGKKILPNLEHIALSDERHEVGSPIHSLKQAYNNSLQRLRAHSLDGLSKQREAEYHFEQVAAAEMSRAALPDESSDEYRTLSKSIYEHQLKGEILNNEITEMLPKNRENLRAFGEARRAYSEALSWDIDDTHVHRIVTESPHAKVAAPKARVNVPFRRDLAKEALKAAEQRGSQAGSATSTDFPHLLEVRPDGSIHSRTPFSQLSRIFDKVADKGPESELEAAAPSRQNRKVRFADSTHTQQQFYEKELLAARNALLPERVGKDKWLLRPISDLHLSDLSSTVTEPKESNLTAPIAKPRNHNLQ